MNDLVKWLLKIGISAVVWVFVLSINYDGRTIFSYAHASLVDNTVVAAVDEQLSELWAKVSTAAQSAVTRTREGDGDNAPTDRKM